MANEIEQSDFKSKAWQSQQSAWALTSDLWQSPLYIREQKTKYLEQFKKEKSEKYEERLGRSVPRNKFRESIETMAGMVFKDNPAPQDAPTALADLFTDIDACGNSLHSFLLNGFEKYLRDGGGAILVDATPLSPAAREKVANNEPLTGEDRKDDRPFWVFIEAKQIINARYEKIGGIDTLTQVTIETCETEPAGEFGEAEIKRHYILRRGEFEVRKYDESKKEFVTELDKGGSTGLTEIPLVPLAPFGSPPPLLELAMLTIQHYNKKSDFDNWCHIACVPRQVIKLKDDQDAAKYKELNQSADVGLIIFGEHADAKYLEVTGAGLDIAKQSIDDVLSEMSAIGVGMLVPSDMSPKSATEVVDTAGQRQSKLARFARDFENCVEKAFYHTAEYLKIIRGSAAVDLNQAENTSLKLKMDFDRLTFSPDQMAIARELLANGDLSHETFFEMLPNVIDMPKGWTPEIEKQRLSSDEPVINAGKMPPLPIPEGGK